MTIKPGSKTNLAYCKKFLAKMDAKNKIREPKVGDMVRIYNNPTIKGRIINILGDTEEGRIIHFRCELDDEVYSEVTSHLVWA